MTAYRKYIVYVNEYDLTMTRSRMLCLLNSKSAFPVAVHGDYEVVQDDQEDAE